MPDEALLDSLTDQDAAEADGAAPDPAAAAPAAPAADDRLAVLEAELAELRNARQEPAADPRQLASALQQAIVGAEAERRRQYDAEQAQMREMQPPTLTEEEKAEIIANPDLLWSKMMEVAKYGARAAVAHLTPRLQQAARQSEIAHQLAFPSVDLHAEYALEKARAMADKAGIGDAFNEVADEAYRIMQEASRGDALEYTKMALKPQAIYAAAQMAINRQGGGPRVRRTATAPSIGAGDQSGARRASRPEAVGRMEKLFGMKFSEDDLREVNKRAEYFNANGI